MKRAASVLREKLAWWQPRFQHCATSRCASLHIEGRDQGRRVRIDWLAPSGSASVSREGSELGVDIMVRVRVRFPHDMLPVRGPLIHQQRRYLGG